MAYALVTGASKGIGRSIAEELARKGKDVLLVARNPHQLQEVCAEIEKKYKVAARSYSIDLSQTDSAKKIFEWCTRNSFDIDVLVNNAGFGLSGSFEKYSLEEHVGMMQVNMNTVVELTYYFLPQLKLNPKGYILNIASSAGYQATPFLSLYSASKSFVMVFSRGLNHELKKTNVSVTCVNPGSTDTAFNDRAQLQQKALDLAKKVSMTADEVAKEAVDAMYKRKAEVIVGAINKLGAFLVWLLPKKIIEKSAAKIYQ